MPNIIKTFSYSERSIPAAEAHRPQGSVETPSVTEAIIPPKESAEEILNEAKKKAAKTFEHTVKEGEMIAAAIKEDAKRQGEEIKKHSAEKGYQEGLEAGKAEGYAKGFDEGYEEGLKRAQNENRFVLESLKEATAAWDAQKQEMTERFSNGLDDLVLLISKAVLKREVEIHPEYLAQLAYESISDYNAHAWIKILISEHAYQTIRENVPDFTDYLGGNVKLVSNHDMCDSDCLCETPSHIIDAGIDTQFENIEQALGEE